MQIGRTMPRKTAVNPTIPGTIVWAKWRKSYWPAIVLRKEDWDCFQLPKTRVKCPLVVLWFCSSSLSLVGQSDVYHFLPEFKKHFKYVKNKKFKKAVLDAIREFRSACELPPMDAADSLAWARNGCHDHLYQRSLEFSPEMQKVFAHLRSMLSRGVSDAPDQKLFESCDAEDDCSDGAPIDDCDPLEITFGEIPWDGVCMDVGNFEKTAVVVDDPDQTDPDQTDVDSKSGEDEDMPSLVDKCGDVVLQGGLYGEGTIVWAKFGSNFWPGIVLEKSDWNLSRIPKVRAKDSYLIFWLDSRPSVSLVSAADVFPFMSHFSRFYKGQHSKKMNSAVLHAIGEMRNANGLAAMHAQEDLLKWAKDPGADGTTQLACSTSSLSWGVRDSIEKLKRNLNNNNNDDFSDAEDSDESSLAEKSINKSQIFKKMQESMKERDARCLSCGETGILTPHPLFVGKICASCLITFKKKNFSLGESDGVNFYCTVCWKRGSLFSCSNALCYRCFCKPCIEAKAAPGALQKVKDSDEWFCFLCNKKEDDHGLLEKRSDWERNIVSLFHPDIPTMKERLVGMTRGITVLLCEGSCHVAVKVLQELTKISATISKLYLCKYTPEETNSVVKQCPRVVIEHRDERIEELHDFTLASLQPIDIIVAEPYGQDVLTFFCVKKTLDVGTPSRVPHFVLVVSQASVLNYNKAVTRCFELEPSVWTSFSRTKLVWTNMWELKDQMVSPPLRFLPPRKTLA